MSNESKGSPRTELVVMSRPAMQGITLGHIMIAVSRAGEGEQAWGFYPDGVKDEILAGGWHRYTSSTVIQLNEGQYKSLLAAINNYRSSKKYELLTSNCKHFVITVLMHAGIQVPEDTLFPNDQGKAFMKMYGEGWGSCLAE